MELKFKHKLGIALVLIAFIASSIYGYILLKEEQNSDKIVFVETDYVPGINNGDGCQQAKTNEGYSGEEAICLCEVDCFMENPGE